MNILRRFLCKYGTSKKMSSKKFGDSGFVAFHVYSLKIQLQVPR